MTTLEIAIAKIKKLPAEQRNEVIKFIEFLEFKVSEPADRPKTIKAENREISFSEVAKDFIGCLESNLEDLSYNPKYMEGFGK